MKKDTRERTCNEKSNNMKPCNEKPKREMTEPKVYVPKNEFEEYLIKLADNKAQKEYNSNNLTNGHILSSFRNTIKNANTEGMKRRLFRIFLSETYRQRFSDEIVDSMNETELKSLVNLYGEWAKLPDLPEFHYLPDPFRFLYGYISGNGSKSARSAKITKAIIYTAASAEADSILFPWLNELLYFSPDRVLLAPVNKSNEKDYYSEIEDLRTSLFSNNNQKIDKELSPVVEYIHSRLNRFFGSELKLEEKINLMTVRSVIKATDIYHYFRDLERKNISCNESLRKKSELLAGSISENQRLVTKLKETNSRLRKSESDNDILNHRIINLKKSQETDTDIFRRAYEHQNIEIANLKDEIIKLDNDNLDLEEKIDLYLDLNDEKDQKIADLKTDYELKLSELSSLKELLNKANSDINEKTASMFVEMLANSFNNVNTDLNDQECSLKNIRSSSKELSETLIRFASELGLTPFGTLWEKAVFDPDIQQSTEPLTKGTIVEYVTIGWKLNGRVIRKAEVEEPFEI